MNKSLFIRAEWDDEASVWVATSDDVPGLVTEAASIEALMEKLRVMVPELLDANGYPDAGEVPIELLTRRFESLPRHSV
jgi:predicted RNase H-like HicB family nuclease